MTWEPSSDVTQALTTLGASSMPYRNFVTSSSTSAPLNQVVHDTSGFPLLTSALPEVAQFSIPHTLSPRAPAVDNVESLPMTPLVATNVEISATGTERPEMPGRSSYAVPPQAKQNPTLARPTVSLRAKTQSRYGRAPRDEQPHVAVSPRNGIDAPTRSLSEVYRILDTSDNSYEERKERHSGLQYIFSLL